MLKIILFFLCAMVGPCSLPSPTTSIPSCASVQARPKMPQDRKITPFSFAVISDTHDKAYCGLGQGYTPQAVDLINRLNPAFVIGVGDLIAGGGDCRRASGPDVVKQLIEFRKKVLEKLKVPFVPIAGNHGLEEHYSVDPHYGARAWRDFWKLSSKYVLPQARCGNSLCSKRFTYNGVGFSLITYYDTYGLTNREVTWINTHVQKGDFVFKHINPFGISCSSWGFCGFAMRSNSQVKNLSIFTTLLKSKGVRALFSGHTHAFYDGVCDGLRFINTGSTGTRAMEYIYGWKKSPYKNKQAFVWVDVKADGTFQVSFYVWNGTTFVKFNKTHFPPVIKAKSKYRVIYREGVKAICRSVRR